MNARPPRCPDDLLAADLPDWAKIVWLAVRSVQGGNDTAWADYDTYGERCGKSYDMVRKAVTVLRKAGWLEMVAPASRGRAPHLRCLWPGGSKGENPVPKGENDVPAFGEKGENPVPERRESHSGKVGTGFSIPHTPYKEEPVQESVQEPEQPRGARAGEGKTTAVAKRQEPDTFDAFWAAYPKKRAKKKAATLWAKTTRGKPGLAAEIVADVERRQATDYRWTKDGGRFVPDPTTYLNQERWTDEHQPEPRTSAVDAARERAAAARANPEEAYKRGALEALAALDPEYAGVGSDPDEGGYRLGY